MRTLIVLMLASAALSQSASRLSESVGLDFYQFWGVPVARRVADHALGSPYRDGPRYVAVLREYAARVDQPKLKVVHGLRATPDFAGSPLLYTLFAVVSSDYTLSLRTFQVLQLVAFLGALLLLGHLCRVDPFYPLCLALLGVLAYQPLLSDLRVANLGCFQLAGLTGLLFVAHTLPRVTSFAARAGLGAAFLAAVALFTLCKPNVVLLGILLTLHLGVRHGRRLLIASAGPAVVVAALGVVLPCVYFGSWAVWREWYGFVYGANAYMLVRPVDSGNYSTVVFLSSWLGPDVYAIAPVLLGLLAVSLLAAGVRGTGSGGRAPSALMVAAGRVCENPWLAAASGLVLTIATAPLYWFHYYVLSLVPAFWLLSAPGSSRYPAALAAMSVVMSSGIFGLPAWWLGWYEAFPAVVALSWLPLWCAVLVRVGLRDAGARQPERSGEGGAASAAPPGRRRRR